MSIDTPRLFGTVSVGDRIELSRGPLRETHLMRWSSAMENWHRIHYDLDFSVNHEKLPGLLISGSLKQQFFVQLLSRWAGEAGWLASASFQFRAMNVVGETLTTWAEVTGLENRPDYGLVSLTIGIRNDAGKESTPGEAIVALPKRAGQRVQRGFDFVQA